MSVSSGSIIVAKCTEVFLARASPSTSALSQTSDSHPSPQMVQTCSTLGLPAVFLAQELASLLPVALECVPTRDVTVNSIFCRAIWSWCDSNSCLADSMRHLCCSNALDRLPVFLRGALSSIRRCFFFLAIHGFARAAGLFSFPFLHLEACLREIRLQEDCRRYLTVGVQHPFVGCPSSRFCLIACFACLLRFSG